MSIKESSDELTPLVPYESPRATSPSRSLSDYFALAVATCGVGYLPLAPGTWGSLVGVGVFLALRAMITQSTRAAKVEAQIAYLAVELTALLVITITGIWAASRTEKLLGRKDPGKVVVDEVAGQMIAMLPIPLALNSFFTSSVIVSFILFRLFDIVKPYPARRLESLPGGLGIMADDLVAGAYGATAVAILLFAENFIL